MSRPAEKPVGNFFQTVDSEGKDNAAIGGGRGLLGGVPLRLSHNPGGIREEANLNVKGPSATEHGPGVAEVGPYIEISRNHCGSIQYFHHAESSNTVCLRLAARRLGDQIPSILDEAKPDRIQAKLDRTCFMWAGVRACNLPPFKKSGLQFRNGLLAVRVVG